MNENAADWFVDRHLKEGRGEKAVFKEAGGEKRSICLLYTSPSPRDATLSRMPSSA